MEEKQPDLTRSSVRNFFFSFPETKYSYLFYIAVPINTIKEDDFYAPR